MAESQTTGCPRLGKRRIPPNKDCDSFLEDDVSKCPRDPKTFKGHDPHPEVEKKTTANASLGPTDNRPTIQSSAVSVIKTLTSVEWVRHNAGKRNGSRNVNLFPNVQPAGPGSQSPSALSTTLSDSGYSDIFRELFTDILCDPISELPEESRNFLLRLINHDKFKQEFKGTIIKYAELIRGPAEQSCPKVDQLRTQFASENVPLTFAIVGAAFLSEFTSSLKKTDGITSGTRSEAETEGIPSPGDISIENDQGVDSANVEGRCNHTDVPPPPTNPHETVGEEPGLTGVRNVLEPENSGCINKNADTGASASTFQTLAVKDSTWNEAYDCICNAESDEAKIMSSGKKFFEQVFTPDEILKCRRTTRRNDQGSHPIFPAHKTRFINQSIAWLLTCPTRVSQADFEEYLETKNPRLTPTENMTLEQKVYTDFGYSLRKRLLNVKK